MACLSPNIAFQHKFVKQKLRFINRKAYRLNTGEDPYQTDAYKFYSKNSDWEPLTLPCQQCVNCRLENAREKAIRIIGEMKTSPQKKGCFLTLTYNQENLPHDDQGRPIYRYSDIKQFVKNLNNHVRYNFIKNGFPGIPDSHLFKTFGCAEYGEKFSRPHFHLCIMNFDFDDKWYWKDSRNDWSDEKWPVFRSDLLEELWPHGYSAIGSLTPESAGYTARYVTKKVSGEFSNDHYDGRPKERLVCLSRGLGAKYFVNNLDAILARGGTVIFKNRQVRMPRYYDKLLQKIDNARFDAIKSLRRSKTKKIDLDGTKERLAVRSNLAELKFQRLVRKFETHENIRIIR